MLILPCNLATNQTEEFAIEIPDEDADRITTVGEGESHSPSHLIYPLHPLMTWLVTSLAAIDYISKSPEAH